MLMAMASAVELIHELAAILAGHYGLNEAELAEKLTDVVKAAVEELLSLKLLSDLADSVDEVERLPESELERVLSGLELEKQAEGVIIVEGEGFTYVNRLMRFGAVYRLRSRLPEAALPVALLGYWYFKLGVETQHAEFAVIKEGKLAWYGWPDEALEELVKPLIAEVFGPAPSTGKPAA